MPFTRAITDDDLRTLARQSASDHLENRVDLNSALVKAASLFDLPLTDQHVRRACEMTYHEVYERLFKGASGSDRYVSFDPPNAAEVSARLRTEKIATARSSVMTVAQARTSVEKVAGHTLPQRFQSTISFTPPKVAEIPLAAPEAEEHRFMAELRGHLGHLQHDVDALKLSAKLATFALVDEARRSLHQGNSPHDVLRVCLEGTDIINPHIPAQFLEKAAMSLVTLFQDEKVVLEKTASTAGTVNAAHPLAVKFEKVANALYEAEVKTQTIAAVKNARRAMIEDAHAA